ncbi:hypothetical protein G6288_003821 [Salmonella enterica]|nr:hypothetical protein [Salmonella enterica]EEO5328194.1 hypothetical protein [Salmonella enterica]
MYDTITFDGCQAQLLPQTLSPDDMSMLNESTEIMPLTVQIMKHVLPAQRAWQLLFSAKKQPADPA